MSAIPTLAYSTHLYDEKVVRSVAHATRRDAEELLSLAGRIPIQVASTAFPLEQANQALEALKKGWIRGAAVLAVSAR
jgi:propanol-preferring alcohol dehydrogenase